MQNSFSQRVYQVVQKIPKGKVVTYGQIAQILGKPKAARAVGQALHKNPYAPIVPCHRVVATSGHLCGFASGLKVKAKLLRGEGVKFKDKLCVDLSESGFYGRLS